MDDHWLGRKAMMGKNKIWCMRCQEMTPKDHVKLISEPKRDGSLSWIYTCPESEEDDVQPMDN